MTDALEEQEKIVKKFKVNPDPMTRQEIKATKEELMWRDHYLAHGNAYAAVMEIWPEYHHKKPGAARVKGSNMMKKFGIKSKRGGHYREMASKPSSPNNPNMIVNHIKELYEKGLIDEHTLFTRMNKLSSSSASDAARIQATTLMRQWLREAQGEIEANKLAIMDIVNLLVEAISELPHDKYLEVLKGCRRKRTEIITERNVVFDADAERAAERERLKNYGGVQ